MVKSMMLQSSIIEQKNITENIESYTSTISHEFRTPLGTCLMIFESLLAMFLHQKQRSFCEIIVR